MFIAFALALSLTGFAQQTSCQPGEVLDVARGRDYTLNICGIGLVALRGVEPPLRGVDGFSDGFGPSAAELLGRKDLGPQAVEYLRELVTGRRVTVVDSGARPGDLPGRRYAYVFLPDKTLVNAELIKRGLGYAARQGSHPRSDEFLALEQAARRGKAGVWAS
jgi:endonuclease YncB( thermonuclease family)